MKPGQSINLLSLQGKKAYSKNQKTIENKDDIILIFEFIYCCYKDRVLLVA